MNRNGYAANVMRFPDVDDVHHRNRNGTFDLDEFDADKFDLDKAVVLQPPTENYARLSYV